MHDKAMEEGMPALRLAFTHTPVGGKTPAELAEYVSGHDPVSGRAPTAHPNRYVQKARWVTPAFAKSTPLPDSTPVRAVTRAGVEMEAMTAVSVAALTIYDMCKAVDRTMIIDQVRLEEKSGGLSGQFRREEK